MRFRRYLGDNYQKEDEFVNKYGLEKASLPIVPIYILSFRLEGIDAAVLKVSREYINILTQKVTQAKTEFTKLLTHDPYIIQVKQLFGDMQISWNKFFRVQPNLSNNK